MSIFETETTEAGDAPATDPPETAVSADGGSGSTPPPEQEEKKRRRRIIAFFLVLALLLGVGALFAWYFITRKPLTELPGLSVATLPHYERSIYGVTGPLGLAVTPTGDLVYVSDGTVSGKVTIFDGAGKQVGTIVAPKAEAAKPHQPMYVAVDPVNQDVYVSDRMSRAIYVYDARGTYLRTFAPKGDLGTPEWAPLALGFAADGSLYVTDVRGKEATQHRVLVFDKDGTLVRSMGKPGELNYPNGVMVDAKGDAYVSDSNNGRLVAFDPSGTIVAQVSSGLGEGDLGMPRGVGLDDSGRLFVVDTTAHMVRVFTVGATAAATPTYVGSFGGEGRLDGTFEYPNGLAVDTRAHIYVTDRLNNRVQVWGFRDGHARGWSARGERPVA